MTQQLYTAPRIGKRPYLHPENPLPLDLARQQARMALDECERLTRLCAQWPHDLGLLWRLDEARERLEARESDEITSEAFARRRGLGLNEEVA